MNELLTTPVPQPKAEKEENPLSSIQSVNIFQTQQDIRDFAMIAAKHLAGKDEQSLYEQLLNVFEREKAITMRHGTYLPALRTSVYEAALKVLPALDESQCILIVNGIIQQFRDMMELDKALGPDFIKRFDQERRTKEQDST